MKSPIEGLINEVLQCVKCGAHLGGCACWIELRCPGCKQKMSVERQAEDYPEAVALEVTCPECNAGDFAEMVYYDKDGKHITRDPNMPYNT